MSFGITELVIILVIVILLFGTTKLKSLGSDLGGAIKGFRNAVTDEKSAEAAEAEEVEPEKKESESAGT
ncbi:MAG: twin-arginine translocase TatA/TatE family subunit [Gammaproteobacteria bacterium]|jgi:sec-independent protein translocase protein TatA|nr:twin-arginine translocase TatA/TatE family subunit [Gammaproteobacteria bacterium]MBT4493453.1 twin-arginine translocase TatA/TatE family subunit [Gammaproteobacteria bacterium]MBT7372329.1 twin-arginine translocase TatA/TatE family subunit [Gammaproteobacteria bacterium]